MTLDLFWLVLLCAAGSTLAALGCAKYLLNRGEHALRTRSLAFDDPSEATVFIFERAKLIHATQAARDYLAILGDGNWSYVGLVRHLSKSFPDLHRALLSVARTGSETVMSFDGARAASLERDGQRIRMSIRTAETDVVTLDRGSHASLGVELESLRAMGDHLAYPTWRQMSDGTVTWVNRAYLDLAQAHAGRDSAKWPPPILFTQLDTTAEDGEQRCQLGGSEDDTGWFDCHVCRIDDDLFVTAVPADKLLKAERTLSSFTQTFSRTFAHLTVGIAVFDRRRELVMFNPALTDLTTLPIDLILGRPRLDTFLDALRARQMMPEPKDYASWRQRVADVETASKDGTYSELWHLPGSRTYRITGRPQVDGAFALLLEDISAEVSLTRRFRTEIETGHAVLNALPDAIAVFDRAGTLVQTNSVYDNLWHLDGDQDRVLAVTAADAIRLWDRASVPNHIWSEARLNLSVDLPPEGWSGDLQMLDGRAFRLHMTPMPAGMRLVRFTLAPEYRRSRLLPSNGQDRIAALLKA